MNLPAVQESFSLMPYLIISGTGLLLLIVLGVVLARLYKRASKEIGFVRTGFGGEKVVMNGGALVLPIFPETDRKRVVLGKSGSVRGDHGGCRCLKNKNIRVSKVRSDNT